jgi:hypothetical protein
VLFELSVLGSQFPVENTELLRTENGKRGQELPENLLTAKDPKDAEEHREKIDQKQDK